MPKVPKVISHWGFEIKNQQLILHIHHKTPPVKDPNRPHKWQHADATVSGSIQQLTVIGVENVKGLKQFQKDPYKLKDLIVTCNNNQKYLLGNGFWRSWPHRTSYNEASREEYINFILKHF